MIKILIGAGQRITINGLAVITIEDFQVELVVPATLDQASELCAAHAIPVDFKQFDYVDEDTDESITHSRMDGGRIVDAAILDKEEEVVETHASLMALSRADLDIRASEVGVSDPATLPNKEAVVEAILAAG